MSDKLSEYIYEEIAHPDRDWSVRELASRAGLSATTVTDVLNGKSKAGLRFYLGIATALHVSVDKLLVLAGELPGRSTHDDFQLEQAIRDLDPDEREMVLDYILWRLERSRSRSQDR